MPATQFGAPHTICKGSSAPIFTVVTCNLSASGCFSQLTTSPTTTPCKPPLTPSTFSTPSISSPVSVRITSNFCGVLEVFT